MSAGTHAQAPRRLAFGLLALLCLGLALRQRLAPPDPPVVLDVVAPPLTRIDALGHRPLVPAGTPFAGTPSARSLLAGGPPGGTASFDPVAPRHGPGVDPRGHALRIRVEAHAIELADRLGPERVGWALAHREALSAELAETAVWRDLVQALRTSG